MKHIKTYEWHWKSDRSLSYKVGDYVEIYYNGKLGKIDHQPAKIINIDTYKKSYTCQFLDKVVQATVISHVFLDKHITRKLEPQEIERIERKLAPKNKERFWLVPTTDPYLEMSLKDIGMNSEERKKFLDYQLDRDKSTKIWIFRKPGPYRWSWTGINDVDQDIKYYEEQGMEYMGELYEVETNAEKYNL